MTPVKSRLLDLQYRAKEYAAVLRTENAVWIHRAVEELKEAALAYSEAVDRAAQRAD